MFKVGEAEKDVYECDKNVDTSYEDRKDVDSSWIEESVSIVKLSLEHFWIFFNYTNKQIIDICFQSTDVLVLPD